MRRGRWLALVVAFVSDELPACNPSPSPAPLAAASSSAGPSSFDDSTPAVLADGKSIVFVRAHGEELASSRRVWQDGLVMASESWRRALKADPVPWLLEDEAPAVRHLTLRWLLDEPEGAPRVRRARAAAMRADPIAATLANQDPGGYWVKSGPGYVPKYTGTVWSVMFLDQLGADPRDRRIQRACEYVLDHTQAPSGGFGWNGTNHGVVHCLHGNLLHALVGFGWLDDERVRRAIEWQARSITGEGFDSWYRGPTTGPGFACAINGGLPCAWGAIKALRGLTAITARRRSRLVRGAIAVGAEFLLSRDPAVADYPAEKRVSPNWFKLGFPSGYVADMLQNLEVLSDLGYAKDARLSNAIEAVLSKQDDLGRWRNEYAYARTTWVPFERVRSPSKWVTLRACRVLKAAL